MKEKIKNLNNKKVVITTLCAFAIVLLLGFTYAYWSRTFTQTGENVSMYDCFDITFSENTDGISMENGYPISDEEGLKTEAYEVTITNTCNIIASYDVILNKLNTSTLDNSHIKIAVNNDIKLLSNTTVTTSNITNASEARIINSGALAGGQSKIIRVQNWMDENTSESEGVNKAFSYKIIIEATPNSKLLAAQVLKSPYHSQIPDFTTFAPAITGYQEAKQSDGSIEKIAKYGGVINQQKTLGNSYEFDKTTGLYKLTNTVSMQIGNEAIGKYFCISGSTNQCKRMFKIKEVELSTADTPYTLNDVLSNQAVNFTSSANKMVGTSYTLGTDGRFVIANTTTNVSYSSDYIDYYTCNTNTDKCTTLYKIKVVNGSTVTSVDTYSRAINRNYITKADIYTNKITSDTKENGLYKTEDDDGDSYYFRGNITNNYVSLGKYPEDVSIYTLRVDLNSDMGYYDMESKEELIKYCNENYSSSGYTSLNHCLDSIEEISYKKGEDILWRVVRINGDGTIRLISDDLVGYSSYNDDQSNYKYIGYTYNNNHICTKDNPCNTTDGESTTIKTNLEDWYNKVFKDNANIAESRFCNDTSVARQVSTNYYYYGNYNRFNGKDVHPTLICPDTAFDYGGNYKLKIGLLTADEASFAGMYHSTKSPADINTTDNYLFEKYSWWSMSPFKMNEAIYLYASIVGGDFSNIESSRSWALKPVINLKADIKITSGDGTKDNPYVVE